MNIENAKKFLKHTNYLSCSGPVNLTH